MEMDVPDDGSRRCPGPGCLAHGRQKIAHVERFCRHCDLPTLVTPLRARAVGVDLDAETVGIGEVDGLTHQVVRHAGLHAGLREVPYEPCEVGAFGQEEGDVEEPEEPSPGDGPCPRPLDQFDQRSVVAGGTEDGRTTGAAEHAEAEYALVEGERPREVGHLETHASEPRRGREPVARWCDADCGSGVGWCHGHIR